MTRNRTILALLALLPLLLLGGCRRQAPQIATPQLPPPLVEPEPVEMVAEEIVAEEEPVVAAEPEPAPEPAPPPRRPRPTVIAPAPPPPEPEPEPVAQPTISAGLSESDAAHHRSSTEQLLDSAEANLRRLNRRLNSDEQSVVQQIRNYVQQARQATAAADLLRARNLALKAHLLSSELIRR